MNAYELADLMLDVTNCVTSEYYQAGMMLRQQADRIAELSKNVDELEEELLKATHPNVEPVAYVNSMCNDCIDWKVEPMNIDGKPLYTTPQKYCPSENNAAYEKGVIDGMAKQRQSRVDGIIGQIGDSPIHDLVHRTTPQIKELSDEEIEDLIDNWDFGLDISPKHHMFLLCKTILKKASEK